MWLERLEREHVNLRVALRWTIEQGEAGHSMEMALRLGGALWWFWGVRGHWSEGRNFLERALVKSVGIEVSVRAEALLAAAHLAFVQSDYDRTEALCEEQRKPYVTLLAYPSLLSSSLTTSARSRLRVSTWESERSLPPGPKGDP